MFVLAMAKARVSKYKRDHIKKNISFYSEPLDLSQFKQSDVYTNVMGVKGYCSQTE